MPTWVYGMPARVRRRSHDTHIADDALFSTLFLARCLRLTCSSACLRLKPSLISCTSGKVTMGGDAGHDKGVPVGGYPLADAQPCVCGPRSHVHPQGWAMREAHAQPTLPRGEGKGGWRRRACPADDARCACLLCDAQPAVRRLLGNGASPDLTMREAHARRCAQSYLSL